MLRVAGVLGATALVGTFVAGSATSAGTASVTDSADSATARTADTAEPPWVPVDEEDFTVPTEVCGFEVRAHILNEDEFSKTVTTYPDGSPQTQLFKGPLVIRYTNVETGKSVDANASGNAFETFRPDGSLQNLTISDDGSHFVANLRPGAIPSNGIFLVSGEWSSLAIRDDGIRQLFLGPNGTAENLCDPLSS
jgi:hypothetical protein